VMVLNFANLGPRVLTD